MDQKTQYLCGLKNQDPTISCFQEIQFSSKDKQKVKKWKMTLQFLKGRCDNFLKLQYILPD